MTVWPDVNDPTIRKCPRHKCWVQLSRQGRTGEKLRFCPRCVAEQQAKKNLEQDIHAAKQQELGMPVPPKPRIITI
jgi:hypothetical protein